MSGEGEELNTKHGAAVWPFDCYTHEARGCERIASKLYAFQFSQNRAAWASLRLSENVFWKDPNSDMGKSRRLARNVYSRASEDGELFSSVDLQILQPDPWSMLRSWSEKARQSRGPCTLNRRGRSNPLA